MRVSAPGTMDATSPSRWFPLNLPRGMTTCYLGFTGMQWGRGAAGGTLGLPGALGVLTGLRRDVYLFPGGIWGGGRLVFVGTRLSLHALGLVGRHRIIIIIT